MTDQPPAKETDTSDTHPASKTARELVASSLQRTWTKSDQRMFRLKLVAFGIFPGVRRRMRNDRAARRLGFAPNSEVMSLPHNSIDPSSLDALSLQQREEGSSDIDTSQMEDSVIDNHRHNLEILPIVLWSMGKSFHTGDRSKRLILREARHHQLFPNGNQRLFDMYNSDDNAITGLIAWALPLPFILGSQSGRWRKNRFLALSYFLGCALLDRTETFNDELGIKLINLHPIPRRNPHFNKPLRAIMLERAREGIELCRKRGNKEIWLLWSGGIDTTAAVCAFLQVTDGSPEDRELLVVYYQDRSIAEYPAFFHDVISKLSHKVIEGHVGDIFNVTSDQTVEETPLVVTGDPADMLFGTFRMAGALEGNPYEGRKGYQGSKYSLKEKWQYRAPRLLHERRLLLNPSDYHWSNGHPKRISFDCQFAQAAREWVEWMTPQVKKSPVPIVTIFDWWYWVTYSCKYNHDVHRIFYNRREIPRTLRNRVFNFYDSPDFHQYSFNMHHKKMKHLRVWASYKHTLKEFILNYCQQMGLAQEGSEDQWESGGVPDDHTVYYHAKIKVPSVASSWGMEVGIDDKWNVVKFGACSISEVALRNDFPIPPGKYIGPLQETLLTPVGQFKVKGDQMWIEGKWEQAFDFYMMAVEGGKRKIGEAKITIDAGLGGIKSHVKNCVKRSSSMDCTRELLSCRRAYNRQRHSKPVGFIHNKESLRAPKLRAISSHFSWRERHGNQTLLGTFAAAGE